MDLVEILTQRRIAQTRNAVKRIVDYSILRYYPRIYIGTDINPVFLDEKILEEVEQIEPAGMIQMLESNGIKHHTHCPLEDPLVYVAGRMNVGYTGYDALLRVPDFVRVRFASDKKDRSVFVPPIGKREIEVFTSPFIDVVQSALCSRCPWNQNCVLKPEKYFHSVTDHKQYNPAFIPQEI